MLVLDKSTTLQITINSYRSLIKITSLPIMKDMHVLINVSSLTKNIQEEPIQQNCGRNTSFYYKQQQSFKVCLTWYMYL